jgi:LysM repeat protein
MDTHDITPKSQPTGGLKLMTVFIAVLALHIVVIGGFTVYHLMSAGTSDADLLSDKTHRDVKVSPDALLPGDTTVTDSDKPATAATPDATASTAPADPSNPAPTTTTATAATASATSSTPSGPITAGTTPATPSFPVVSPPATPAPTDSGTVAMTPETDSSTMVATYTVRKGDTLHRIAHKLHVTVAQLRSANNFASDKLHIGQKVTIPAKDDESGATAMATAAEPSTPVADPAPAPAVTHHAAATTGAHHLYTVAKGDTLSKIAHRFKVSTKALIAANDIADPAKLSIGRKLRIPSGAHSSVSSSPAHAPADQDEPAAKPAPAAQLVNLTQ